VESAPPHDVLLDHFEQIPGIYNPTLERMMEDAERKMRRGMDQYRRCTEAGIWPGAGYSWEDGEYSIVQIGRKDVL
jgi:hypothetical protein